MVVRDSFMGIVLTWGLTIPRTSGRRPIEIPQIWQKDGMSAPLSGICAPVDVKVLVKGSVPATGL